MFHSEPKLIKFRDFVIFRTIGIANFNIGHSRVIHIETEGETRQFRWHFHEKTHFCLSHGGFGGW